MKFDLYLQDKMDPLCKLIIEHLSSRHWNRNGDMKDIEYTTTGVTRVG